MARHDGARAGGHRRRRRGGLQHRLPPDPGGWRDVVLLERAGLTSGSTFHRRRARRPATVVGHAHPPDEVERRVLPALDAETGRDPGWREVGSLRLASSPERLEELRRQVGCARTFGLPLTLIDAGRGGAALPDDLAGGLQGAVFLPPMVTSIRAAWRRRWPRARDGGRLDPDRRAGDGHRAEGGAGPRVVTGQAPIQTDIVVNAAGIWAPEIGRMAGVTMPLVPMHHQYLITKPIDGVHPRIPTMRDPDLLDYFREEVGGLVVGGYERQPAPWALDGIPADFNDTLLAPDWEQLRPADGKCHPARPGAGRLPKSCGCLNGPEAFTPDGEFILGEAPRCEASGWPRGFCAHGLAGAGGVGQGHGRVDRRRRPGARPLAHGPAPLRRAVPSRRYVAERAVEVYAKYYDIALPDQERRERAPAAAAPGLPGSRSWARSSARRPAGSGQLVRAQRGGAAPSGGGPRLGRAGLVAGDRGRAPGGPRERVGPLRRDLLHQVRGSGPGALAFLQRLAANDIDRPSGSVTYTAMLNRAGGHRVRLHRHPAGGGPLPDRHRHGLRPPRPLLDPPAICRKTAR